MCKLGEEGVQIYNCGTVLYGIKLVGNILKEILIMDLKLPVLIYEYYILAELLGWLLY